MKYDHNDQLNIGSSLRTCYTHIKFHPSQQLAPSPEKQRASWEEKLIFRKSGLSCAVNQNAMGRQSATRANIHCQSNVATKNSFVMCHGTFLKRKKSLPVLMQIVAITNENTCIPANISNVRMCILKPATRNCRINQERGGKKVELHSGSAGHPRDIIVSVSPSGLIWLMTAMALRGTTLIKHLKINKYQI